jgi:hypothetical protein
MGAAQSTNVANQTLNAITTIATKMINKQQVSSLQAQGIIIKNAQSDVIISGNHFNQSVNINLEALLKAVSTQNAQQDLMQQLSQVADSLNKQLNLFQYADSNNIVNQYLNAVIDLSTNITQTCVTLAQQSQTISLDTIGGIVQITDNTFNQTQSIISKCMYDVLSNSEAIQKVQQSANQTAKATNSGVNIWAIVIMMILGVIVLIFPELLPLIIIEKAIADVIKIILDMFFILMIIGGIISIVCYCTLTKNIISLDGDVPPISTINECGASVIKSTSDYKNPEDAGNACLDKKYQAFDFNTIDGKTTFYSPISNSCENILLSKQTTSKPNIVPKFNNTIFSSLPNIDNFNYKDVIVLLNGKIYYCNHQGDDNKKVWNAVQDSNGTDIIYFSISDLQSDQVLIVYSIPTSWISPKIRIIIYVPSASEPIGTEYRIYTNPGDISKYDSRIPSPLYNYQPNPNLNTNQWSGFNIKVKKLNNVYLWLGIILIIVGFIGFIFQMMSRKKQNTKLKQIQLTKKSKKL